MLDGFWRQLSFSCQLNDIDAWLCQVPPGRKLLRLLTDSWNVSQNVKVKFF